MKLFLKDLIMVILGSVCYALALTMLAIPSQLTEGGIPGAAIILHYAFDWSPGIITFILTTIIMLIGYKFLPKRALLLSILTVPLISLSMFFTEGLVGPVGDPLVAAIFAGLFIGVGIGLILRTGSSMGGTSLIAKMLHDTFGFDMVRTIFVLDLCIVLSGMLVIGPLNTLYTIIALFIAKKSTDLIIDGLDPRKAVSIISNKAPLIADGIIDEMNLSVTVLTGYGGYSKHDSAMTYVIVNKFQVMPLKRVINTIDKNAFVVIHDVRDVFGGSFGWEEKKTLEDKR